MKYGTGVVAIEEHFWIPELRDAARGLDRETNPNFVKRLDDLGELRLREMDEAGIDLQVISHAAPAAQKTDPETAVAMARRANDRLHEAEVGVERILFSVDWPFMSNTEARGFIEAAPLSDADKKKILSENARTLLRLPKFSLASIPRSG